MTRRVAVRELMHLRLAPPVDDRWIHDVSWIPVSATEVHLACRYYPMAIRFEGKRPRLGLIIDQRYTAYPLLDAAGQWRGAYRPIALRCFPFEASNIGDDPLSDLMIDPDSGCLSTTAGAAMVDNTGRPVRQLTEVHRMLGLLKRAQDSFATALDQYLIGDLLVPLPGADADDSDPETVLYVLDLARFSQMEHAALGAMARHGFTSVDVAVACHFSLQNLRPQHRPKSAGQARHRRLMPAAALDMITIDDLPLALDDSELIALWDIDALRVEAHRP